MAQGEFTTAAIREDFMFDVVGLGNPLIDILATVESDRFLAEIGLTKGIMHLIERERKDELLRRLEGVELYTDLGGSCPNTIATLARLGVRTGLAGSTGRDLYGDLFEEKLAERGIASFLSRKRADTGICTILITPDGERTMNTYLGACREFRPGDLVPDMIREARYFYVTGYMWDTENQKEAVERGIRIARESGVKVVFDIADPFAVERSRKDFLRILEEEADVVFANAQEAHFLQEARFLRESEMRDGTVVCEDARYLGRLCEIAVVKDGARETHIVHNQDLARVATFQCCLQDTTGAGDNFAAGFLYGLIKGHPLEQCGQIASFVASKTIEKIGGQAPDDIRELLEKALA
jgi:sugar/nucleoside kinase (ribokinase family)